MSCPIQRVGQIEHRARAWLEYIPGLTSRRIVSYDVRGLSRLSRGHVMTKQWHVLIVASDKRNRGWLGQISLNARSLNMQQRARAFVVSARVKGLDTTEHDLCSWNDERPRTPAGMVRSRAEHSSGLSHGGGFISSRACVCTRVCFTPREIGISRLSRPNDQALAR